LLSSRSPLHRKKPSWAKISICRSAMRAPFDHY
jgi:hypothetical protein